MTLPRSAETGPRPSPQAAYARWTDACTSAGWRGKPAMEQVPVRDGLGRVTAAPVRARWPAPRSDCAAMDGIAISSDSAVGRSDSAGGRADSAGGGAGPAGQWRLAASAFAWIDTGDPMPAGLDTVVERERVRLGADGSAQITGPAPRGLHVRAAGEDFKADELLVPAGHLLRPADLAVAAAAGHVTLEIARRPVAAIIPTGNEIAPIGATLRPGDVIDSNSLMLASRASQIGARPLISDVQPDDPDAIAAEVRRTALTADIVLIIAGSSAGRGDHSAAVLAQVGGLAVRGVAVRPGHPVLLGYASRSQMRADQTAVVVPVIGLPGYPLAAAVIFELFAVPLLAALQGRRPPALGRQHAQLACDWTSSPDVEDWVPVSLTAAPAGQQGGCTVMATPSGRGAGSIARLVRADAWWPIPIGQARFARGAHIDVQPIAGAPG